MNIIFTLLDILSLTLVSLILLLAVGMLFVFWYKVITLITERLWYKPRK